MQGFTVPESDRIQPPQGGAGPRVRQIIPPAPKAPPAPKTTYGVLSPAEVAKLGLPPGSYQRSSEGNIDKIADAPKPGATSDPRDAVREITNVIDKAKQARRKSLEWFATGALSGVARKFGGTEAANVKGLLDTVGANTAFEQLQKMRAESPTGGALGSVTERELDLLKSTIASLDPNQSDEQFQKSMLDIIKSYGSVLMKLPGGREEAIRRGWAVGNAPKAPAPKPSAKKGNKPAVIDFNDLPE